MIWGSMTASGVGFAMQVEGRMDSEQYVRILDACLPRALEKCGLQKERAIFQQDNDPKHTSRRARNWLQSQGFQTMRWPSQSPDLNPIEHLWYHLKRELGKAPEVPRSRVELAERVMAIWTKIPPEVCYRLVSSMPDRIAAVIKAKSGPTKY